MQNDRLIVGLGVHRENITLSFWAPSSLLTAAVAFGFVTLLAFGLSVDHPVAAGLTVATLLAGFPVQYVFGDVTATPDCRSV